MRALSTVWHFHRPELAALYLDTLDAGLVTSATIFAPRRSGKTSFLLQDLKPAAAARGFTVAYADLWQTRTTPETAIVHALELALAPETGRLGDLLARAARPVRKLKARAGVGAASIEGELELAREALPHFALDMEKLIATLCRRGPLLLLVDEAQELAKNEATEAVATALRTAMTLHQHELRVVFTGSSRSRLAHVFSNASAPLYSTGAAIAPFPLLDDDFVDYVAARFAASSGRTLPMARAKAAFAALRHQPEPFLGAVVAMLLDVELDFDQAIAAVIARRDHEDNHVGLWATLDALQRALLRLLAEDPQLKPFSKPVLARLRAMVGVDAIDPPQVQRSLQRLEAIVGRGEGGGYEFENPDLADWVRKLAD